MVWMTSSSVSPTARSPLPLVMPKIDKAQLSSLSLSLSVEVESVGVSLLFPFVGPKSDDSDDDDATWVKKRREMKSGESDSSV